MDCGLAPRCPNRFLSLDGKLLMDAIYDGDDWVDHYTWRLVGSNDNGDVVFDGLCPKHLHPFRLVGLDEIGSKRLLAGEKVELTYRSMISILRLADVLRK